MDLFDHSAQDAMKAKPRNHDPLAHVKTLESLRAEVEAFTGCGLKKTAQRTVFSDGNPQAKIMLIGEAPGADEDEQGKPFVGRSGQLLRKMMASIGIDESHMYITNVMFWRPPENRTPTPKELATTRHFVEKHIALVQPDILIFVGATSAKYMLQTKVAITKLRHNWHSYYVPALNKSIQAMPIFHPAYLLRNPPAKKEAWEDMKMVRQRIEELNLPRYDVPKVFSEKPF